MKNWDFPSHETHYLRKDKRRQINTGTEWEKPEKKEKNVKVYFYREQESK